GRNHQLLAPRDPAEQRARVARVAALAGALAGQKKVKMALDLAFQDLTIVPHVWLLLRFPCRSDAPGVGHLQKRPKCQSRPPCGCATSRPPTPRFPLARLQRCVTRTPSHTHTMSGSGCGQREPEAGTPTRFIVDADGSTVRFHDALGDREPQAGASASYAVALVVPIEDVRQHVGRNAGPGVADRETHPTVLVFGREDDPGPPGPITERISEQI